MLRTQEIRGLLKDIVKILGPCGKSGVGVEAFISELRPVRELGGFLTSSDIGFRGPQSSASPEVSLWTRNI